jgi:hypothetical protein
MCIGLRLGCSIVDSICTTTSTFKPTKPVRKIVQLGIISSRRRLPWLIPLSTTHSRRRGPFLTSTILLPCLLLRLHKSPPLHTPITRPTPILIISNLLIQHNTIHTRLEQRKHQARFPLQTSQAIEYCGAGLVREIEEEGGHLQGVRVSQGNQTSFWRI